MAMQTRYHFALPAMIAIAIPSLVGWVAVRPLLISHRSADPPPASVEIASAATGVDQILASRWQQAAVEPAEQADDLQVFRRLTLALVGTAPSLEEIRQFEGDRSPDRVQRWTTRLINDSRFVEYFAARLGDALVDPVEENLKPPQRERFRRWLGRSIQRGAPYGEMVREMIAGKGGITDHPANTLVAIELSLGDQAAERLAARTSRAFLGQRIDCAQCHDHPFADWTQPQFEGLAAYFAQARFRNARLQDTRDKTLLIEDDRTQERREVAAEVPFDPQWLQENKHLREELAAWVTHTENRRFRRAIANRIWRQMFGRPLIVPIDDLPDPGDSSTESQLLDLLADDLAQHGDDLRRMIQLIAATEAFSRASTHPQLDDELAANELEELWAVFPLTELGPQQMIRSMQQASAIRTLRAEATNNFTAMRRYERQHRFVEDYGVAADAEEAQAATIPHTVERLSGNFTRQHSKATMLTAAGRIAAMSNDLETCLDNCYLACLTRLPTAAEKEHFLPQLSGSFNQRTRAVEDIYWTLFNSAEFCWNH